MSASATQNTGGYIDFWGETGDPGRSVICGWLGNPWKEVAAGLELRIEAKTAAGVVQAGAKGLMFVRADVAAIGFGIIVLCEAPASAIAGIEHLDLIARDQQCRLRVGPGTQRLNAEATKAMIRPLILRAVPLDHRTLALASIDLGGDIYQGPSGVSLTVDAALGCGAAGELILGSVTGPETNIVAAGVALPGVTQKIESLRIVTGAPRAFGEALRAPFLLRLDNPVENAWLDVTLADGNAGRTALPAPARADRAALLKALADLRGAWDRSTSPRP